MLANEAEAQDLLQEVFLSLWQKASMFSVDRGSAFAWMVTQVRNRAIDRIRSRRRRSEILDAHAPEFEPHRLGHGFIGGKRGGTASERAKSAPP